MFYEFSRQLNMVFQSTNAMKTFFKFFFFCTFKLVFSLTRLLNILRSREL